MTKHEKNRTTVEIYGEKYKIIGEESADHVQKVADFVDQHMRDIKNVNPSMGSKNLAVLTAVNIVNEHLKTKEKLDQLNKNSKKEED